VDPGGEINFVIFATTTKEATRRFLSSLLNVHGGVPRLFTADLFSPGYFFLMATTKYDIPLLDRDTRFALW
jgi:hypothetical protein